ncbi:hypothetical protein PG985_014930 [Apiospora marii]|uniref:Uncharacterized protein n=1 Tax=Apiospora marii TaxID=335849 RepID=A0ABR1RK03_9PEZI
MDSHGASPGVGEYTQDARLTETPNVESTSANQIHPYLHDRKASQYELQLSTRAYWVLSHREPEPTTAIYGNSSKQSVCGPLDSGNEGLGDEPYRSDMFLPNSRQMWRQAALAYSNMFGDEYKLDET